jgi:hypothetical protein
MVGPAGGELRYEDELENEEKPADERSEDEPKPEE